MHVFAMLLGLLAACVPLAMLADRLKVPSAVTLILGGMALAVIPGMPSMELEPELVLALFLPPLLQLSSYRTDWTNFRRNLRPILLLAVGAVFFTTLTVACIAHWMMPSLPWWAAVALGAIVAPPDAVSAAAVLRRLPLPRDLTGVLEGESLINDASSLVLYRFAVAAALVGVGSFGLGVAEFVGAALGGAAFGWFVGRIAMWVFKRIESTVLDIAVGLLASFAAYLAAESVHASGVLAAVACGWVLDRHQRQQFSAQTRLESAAVWGFIEFLLTSIVFILIGLQLRGIFERLHEYSATQLTVLGLGISAAVILSRLVWVMGTAGLGHGLRWIYAGLSKNSSRARRVLHKNKATSKPMPAAHLMVVSWAGMRGVVSLAIALALPNNFPMRDLIVFAAFCAILATLLVQGTTLGWLIAKMNIQDDADADEAANALSEARAAMENAALEAVKVHVSDTSSANLSQANEVGKSYSNNHAKQKAAESLLEEYKNRSAQAQNINNGNANTAVEQRAQLEIRALALKNSREKLVELKDKLDAESYAALLAELDLEEQQIELALESLADFN